MKNIYQKAKRIIAEYDVRTPSEYTEARALSGGNQQKPLSAVKLTAILIY